MYNKIKVYLAGPYTKGNPTLNTYKILDIANELVKEGFVPFIPHLSHFWHTYTPYPYEHWLMYDNEWLKSCKCLLRIKGESKGADKEVKLAKKLGMPVFYSIKKLKEFYEEI